MVAVALFLEEGVGVEEELLALVLGLRLKYNENVKELIHSESLTGLS